MNQPSSSRDDELSSRLHSVIQSVVRRRIAGEVLPDDVVLLEYAELAENLPTELAKLRLVEQAERLAGDTFDTVHPLAPAPTPGSVRIRCPHCREPFETSGDTLLSQFVCGSCGGQFCLVDPCGQAQDTPQELAHFELLDKIGVGGFGVVWKGFDRQLHRTVAVKLPRQDRMTTQELEKFLREARAAAQLRHPHIVSVHEVGRDHDVVFIVSDYIDGMSLDDWLVGQQPTMRQAAELCLKVADALQHAHEHGVIHRDLKPANILIDHEGRPLITDFGLARRDVGEVTMTMDGQLLGTPAYMSPEQAQGDSHSADPRSDVYSLGVILFQLLTGDLPFRGNTRMVIHQVIHDEPPSPRKFNACVPRDLEAICLRCLSKRPDDRYGTALELARDLQRSLASQPTLARPLRAHQRFTRWCRRRPLIAGLLGALLVSVLSGVTGVLWQWRRAERNLADARKLIYSANMKLAEAAWDQHNIRALKSLVEPFGGVSEAMPDLRGWEWHYFHRLCHQDVMTYSINEGIECAAVASDKHTVVVGTATGKVAAFDTVTRQLRWSIDAFKRRVITIRAAPDGQRIAAVDASGQVKVWTAVRRAELVYDANLGLGELVSATFDRDLSRVAASDRTFAIRICHVAPLEPIASLSGHTANVKSLVFAQDSDQLLSGSEDGSVRLWSIRSGKPATIGLHPDKQWILSVAMSQDDQWIAAGAQDNLLLVWKRGSLEPKLALHAHAGVVHSVGFDSKNEFLVSAGGDRAIRLWRFPEGQLAHTFWGHEDPASAATVLANDTVVSVGQDGAIKLWNQKQNEFDNPLPFRSHVGSAVFGVSGHTLALRFLDGTVAVYEWPEMREAFRFIGPPGMDALAYDELRKVCAVSRADGAIEVWNQQQRVQTLELHTLPARNLTFSRDGRWLAAGSNDQSMSVWDRSSGALKHHFIDNERANSTVAFVPHSSEIVALNNDQVKVIDGDSGQVRRTMSAHKGRVYTAAFNSAGTLLAVGDKSGTITIWDVAKATPRITLTGHTDRVFGCSFAPDDTRLVSCSRDGTIRWWDLNTLRELCMIRGNWGSLEGIVLSPDGWTLLAISQKKDLYLWDPRSQTK